LNKNQLHLLEQITLYEALTALKTSGKEFVNLFTHGTLSVEIYKPDKIDRQKPHSRDEIYVVASGSGKFVKNGATSLFSSGDFLFVRAGVEHYFVDFTDDFYTWVFFYGPEGGEVESNLIDQL
jgi:hypothetical protein